ncbi:MAG: hypothetical protein IKM33_06930 [Clostridia bacterium]|nr:hypothetical protein [Clostridia bacterium]
MKKSRDPFSRLKRAVGGLFDRATGYVRGVGRQADEVLKSDPIDFSAPSIPYYENLAARIGFARVVLYMALLVFVVVTMVSNHRLITYENLYYLAKDIGAASQTAKAQADSLSYPISAEGADFALYRGGLVISGSDEVTAMSASGRQTLSVNVAYADPCARASDKYCITFGRGERSFSVYNAFVQVHTETTDYPVFDAVVGDNGNFAIVTRSRDYKSEVILYDDNMEKQAVYHLGGYVTGISMNEAGDRLGIVSVEAQNGVWETKITVIRIGNRIGQSSTTVMGVVGGTCGFVADERFAVMFTDRLMVVNSDATVTGEMLFDDTVPTLATISRGSVAILFESGNDLTKSVLTVYDKNARELYSVTLDGDHPITKAGKPSALSVSDRALFLRAGDSLFCLSGNGRQLSSTTISHDTLAILPEGDDEVMVCTPAYAYRLEVEDFTRIN